MMTTPSKRPNRNTSRDGYGHRHREQRKRLIRAHVDGTPCWWCGEPMYRDQALDADHSTPLAAGAGAYARADRLLHASCNRQRGDGSRDHQRPALADEPIPHVFPWPDGWGPDTVHN